MKKRLKLLLIALMTVLISVPALSPKQVFAAPTGTVNVSAGAASVIAGDTVTVNVSINATMDIFVAEFQMVYDNNLFEFVSTTGPAATTSPAGVIPFQYDGDLTKNISFDVVFKAKSVGTGKFSVTSPVFVAMDGDIDVEIAMTCSDASVQVMAVGSDDATLSSLQVAGAGLSPEFAKWTMNYTCYVDNSVTAVNIAAVASQGGKVEIGGNFNNLAVGGNNITVTSYAPNGKTMTYTINVVRLEPPTEPPATEPPTTTVPETTIAPIVGSVTVGGVKYTIDSGYSSDMIPAGFDADVMTYEGEDVLAAVSTRYNVTLFYLINDKGEGSFFLYDSKNKSFFPYKVIESSGHRYILADSSYAEKQPSGCTSGQITVNEVTLDAFISDENGDFAYFYAINENGARGWYCYDKAENTVQRMFVVDMGNKPEETTTPPETTGGDKETATDDGRLGSLEDANDNLRKDNSELIKTRNLIIAIASVLLVVMLVIIVVMAAHKSEKKRSIDIDVEDLADEEEEIELAEAELAAEEIADEASKTVEEMAEAAKEQTITADEQRASGDAEPSDEFAATAEILEADTEADGEEIQEALEESEPAAKEEEASAPEPAAEEEEKKPEPSVKDEEAGENGDSVEERQTKEEEDMTKEQLASIKITDEDIKAFEKEAEALTETLAADVSGVIDEEKREIEPEIIDLAAEEEAKAEDAAIPDTAGGTDKKDSDDGIEIIDADDEGDDDFFL